MIVPDKERGQAQRLIELSLQMPSNERIDQYKQMLAREGVPIVQAYLTALDEIERLREALDEIANFDSTPDQGYIDEWAEANAFNMCRDIARKALRGDSTHV